MNNRNLSRFIAICSIINCYDPEVINDFIDGTIVLCGKYKSTAQIQQPNKMKIIWLKNCPKIQ